MTKNINNTNNKTLTEDITSKDDFVRILSSRSGFTLSDTRLFLDTFIEIFEEAMLNRVMIKLQGLFTLSHTLIEGHWGNRAYRDKPGYKEKVWIEDSTRSNLKIGLNMRKLSKSELSISEEE